MRVYIAASWRHEHAVRMLTDELRRRVFNVEVVSFVERAAKMEILAHNPNRATFDEWIWSDDGEEKFNFDTDGATKSDFVVYIGPSGTDAWAEVGAAWSAGVSVIGLWAKGEPAGLMRRMMTKWFTDHRELVNELVELNK